MIADEPQVVPFDVCGPLPTGVTVLEASAGTGKTYTLAALAARYVAQGTPLQRLLMVTFTRMATGELRERVRERLVGVERGLALARRGAPPTGAPDPVVAMLSAGEGAEVALRHRRLQRALAGFDAATIATTHGFCQETLAGLGIAGDLDPASVLVEDARDLCDEVVDDLYVRRFRRDASPAFDRAQAGEIARAAVANPLAPVVAAHFEPAQTRRRLALAVRDELARRKRTLQLITYDDLLTRLHGALTGPGGTDVAARLRARYDVVLVDEFQDTDPLQWEIMCAAFAHPGSTLVLIGDPKQAIYAFRGADVYAYLHAARAASLRATLDVNWRSDQGLIDGCDALLRGTRLGHEGIVYRHVRAAAAHEHGGLTGAPCDAPLRVRVVHRDEQGIERTPRGYARSRCAREHIAADLAADVVALLSCGATLRDPAPLVAHDAPQTATHNLAQGSAHDAAQGLSSAGRHNVAPGHISVLVRTNRNAALIREALQRAGVPAVINGAGSVFAAPAARQWLALLAALERPSSPGRARAAVLTSFFGWAAERVATADERAWEDVHRRLHEWARVLRVDGVAALAEAVAQREDLARRVLARAGGERLATDLRHVAQLLHGAASAEQLGATALTAWLARRIAESADDTGDEERSRRLESDAAAVQVLTIHRSKGLEFPIVYVPFLWEPGYIPRDPHPVVFHDPDAGDARTIDVALAGGEYARHRRRSLAEQRGEDLRLLYVALTRARNQVVLWWAGASDSRDAPLTRLLFARDADGNVAPTGTAVPADEEVVARLEQLAAAAPGRVSVERSRLAALPSHWAPTLPPPGELTVAAFTRRLDLSWRRTSYSDLTALAHEEAVVASEPEESVVVDEPPDDGGITESLGVELPLGAAPAGVAFGTLVHRVLQETDFAAADLEMELLAAIGAAQAWRIGDAGSPGALATGLAAALRTPLGPLVGNIRLSDVRNDDRLDELRFELPLAGGDDPHGRVALATLAAVLREHLSDDDPLAGYAQRLEDPALRQTARGYLTGSLDLVLRVRDATGVGEDRFAVIDYKTNWLAAPGEPLTAWHHRPAALVAEMEQRHYGLQALLYAVALHRYLRWRVPGYDPERQLAGVLYLFLRGMTGPGGPATDCTPYGVFAWRAPAAVVRALSHALDAAQVPA